MTIQWDSAPFLPIDGHLQGSIDSFLQTSSLLKALRAQEIENTPATVTNLILGSAESKLIGIGVSVAADEADQLASSLGTDLIFSGTDFLTLAEANHHEKNIIFVLDRLKATAENRVRITESVTKLVQTACDAIVLLTCAEQRWSVTETFPLQSPYKGNCFEATRYPELGAFFDALGVHYNKRILSDIAAFLKGSRSAQLQRSALLCDVPWMLLRPLAILKAKLQSSLSSLGMYESLEVQSIDFQGRTVTAVGNPALSVIVPRDVIGCGPVSAVLTIDEELVKFYRNLPTAKTQNLQSRSMKKQLTESLRYRGWSISELLKLSLGDFCIQFGNHPKFRMIAHGVQAFEMQGIVLSEQLESLSYEKAYTVMLIRELRKLREETKIYAPKKLSLPIRTENLEAIKAKLVELAKFYRAELCIVEDEAHSAA